jgi:HlyD family secretion protein
MQAAAAAAKLDMARARLHDLAAGSRPEEIERSRAKLAAAEAECDCLTANISLELDSAHLDVDQSQAKFKMAEEEFNRTRLFAPINGTVIWKYIHAGEAIDALRNQAVLAVADQSHLRVRALVDEADYASIAPGQSVRVTAEAFPNRMFRGHVELICDSAGEKPFSTGEAQERHDVRVINVLVSLDESQNLKLGLRVRAYFDTDRKGASAR